VPPPSEAPELGDEPTQLRRLDDATEAHLHRAQEETKKSTQAFKQVQEVIIEQWRIARQGKVSLQTKLEEEKVKIQ
jgi:hypothetical protein